MNRTERGERGNGPWRWAMGFGPKGEGKAGLLGWFAGPGEEGKARPAWEKGLGLSERSGPRDWV